MFNFKRKLSGYSIAAASAILIGTFLPTGAAHAINLVPCGNPEYLHVEFHMYIEDPGVRQYCFANKGIHRMHTGLYSYWWIDKISTGNNRVRYHDKDGGTYEYPKWLTITFPNTPPAVIAIEIL